MSGEDDDHDDMSSDELRAHWELRNRLAMNTGDQLRALDLAEAVHEAFLGGDGDKVLEIVAEANGAGETVGDSLFRMTNLLLAYIVVSAPVDKEIIARMRQLIVNEEIDGISEGFGD